jgi:hypothetical protein
VALKCAVVSRWACKKTRRACGRKGHNGGEKRNVLIVIVLLLIAIHYALRSKPQGGVKVLGMR